DFGLAHLVGANCSEPNSYLTQTGHIVGSVPWVSPEQARGDRELGPASDIYTLGILLYHSLTDSFPYAVDGPLYVVTKTICESAPANPQKLRALSFGPISNSLASILLRSLEKDPAKRFKSGAELATALNEFLEGRFRPPKRGKVHLSWLAGIGAPFLVLL